MAGVVLETLSNKKLIAFGITILVLQVTTYLIGGLVSPRPYNVQQILSTACVDLSDTYDKEIWFWSRGKHSCMIAETLDYESNPDVRANQIVFTFQFPTPRENKELRMSRWHQNMVGVISPEIVYNHEHEVGKDGKKATLTMQARIGARDHGKSVSDWTELAFSTYEDRTLECEAPKTKKDGLSYHCEPFPVFELGSVHYDYYLLNVRLPAFESDDHVNTHIGLLTGLNLVIIHPNGGFTKVWYSYKIVFFPVVLAALIWYWLRVVKQKREPNLLEKTVFALGVAMSFLNLPVEVFTLWVYMPFMLLFGDIRQGIFYSILLCFWVIFAGEHLMDTIEKNRLVVYWKQLSGVMFGCICMFVFELSERGVQLSNPFYSIWDSETSTNLAYAFIILAGIAACVYFLFLCYLMIKVWRNLSAKKSGLPSMPKARRKYYMGIIFRFKFMILVTLFCAALTVIFFIIGQVSEGQWKWDEPTTLEYSSAFLTGVYGMWNLYVLSLLILYAPSHKVISTSPTTDDSDAGEEIEFSAMPTETSALAEFARKAAAD